jgi:predicted CXXCH cytochrome family protein
VPSATLTPAKADLANIDCLICHQEKYKRVKVNGLFVPDTANMTITMNQAVQTVHKPTRVTCLQCHAKGGGGDAYKRGDLALAHGTTSDRAYDVHMAKTGANLPCQKCHTVSEHRIAGRGSDLRQTDLDVAITCSNGTCHVSKASPKDGHSKEEISRHVSRVACQTCHISRFARNASDTLATEATEMHRDWTKPHVVQTATGPQQHPTPTLVNDVKPVYRFWNKYSDNYNFGDVEVNDPSTGRFPTSRPLGDIADRETTTKLYPFKYKTAYQPATLTNKLIALNTKTYFSTGNVQQSVLDGLGLMGLSGQPWGWVTTDTFQLITHEVRPKEQALTCNSCHGATATQMNLKSLGYTLKQDQSTLCVQCHERKESQFDWLKVHDKHVKDKGFDCSRCHTFSRPERGLR